MNTSELAIVPRFEILPLFTITQQYIMIIPKLPCRLERIDLHLPVGIN